MKLVISAGMGYIYEEGKKRKGLGFIDGIRVADQEGKAAVSVSGSDEYCFEVERVTSYKVRRRSRYAGREVEAVVEKW